MISKGKRRYLIQLIKKRIEYDNKIAGRFERACIEARSAYEFWKRNN